MQARSSLPERWQFSAAVLLPSVLALATTAAAVLGFVLWSTSNIDQRARERQTLMVTHIMEDKREDAKRDLLSVAVWDEAVVNTRVTLNLDWVHANIGEWMYSVLGYSRAVVFNKSNRPLYVMKDGAPLAPVGFDFVAAPLLPLAERLRAAPAPAGTNVPRSLADFALVEGKPALVTAITIVSDSGTLPQPVGTEPVLVGVTFLDQVAAAELNRHYLFDEGSFSLTRSTDADLNVYPVLNNAGRLIAFFEWSRDRPGLLLLHQTGPVLAAAFVMAGLLVYLLLRQVRRSSAAVEASRREVEHQAAHDKLTGLPNRASFDLHLGRMLEESRTSGAQISLLMLDLDRFKQVNDTLGHQAGDALIDAVGGRIRAIVGPDLLLARLGGDEFGIVAVSQGPALDIMSMSHRIIEAARQPFDLGHFKAHVGVSIGIVTANGAQTGPHDLVRKADIALYEAKAGGRNRAVVYEEHMNELLQLQHTIEGELREALHRDDQLAVAFQPLVDQKSRKVIGAEALARWTHPKYGQISPARFIPVAENTGLIEALGEFVLRRACELGAKTPGRTIAVNISPTQLRNPRFSNEVFDILHQTGMRPTDLELEITESILLDDEHISSQNLRTFRTAGIHIALDDFGTGYSSLSYLKRYPVDRIKIDRSFVSQLAEGHVSVAITQAIVTLAHAMDIEVTAEGVETEDQATILGKLGCNTLQGFLFSGAVAPARISEIFADKANVPVSRRRRRAA